MPWILKSWIRKLKLSFPSTKIWNKLSLVIYGSIYKRKTILKLKKLVVDPSDSVDGAGFSKKDGKLGFGPHTQARESEFLTNNDHHVFQPKIFWFFVRSVFKIKTIITLFLHIKTVLKLKTITSILYQFHFMIQNI